MNPKKLVKYRIKRADSEEWLHMGFLIIKEMGTISKEYALDAACRSKYKVIPETLEFCGELSDEEDQ